MNQSEQDPGPRVPIKIEQALAACVIAVIALITLANVISRYVTNYSFAFTEEYSIALMVIMTMLGGAAAFAGDKHIRITYLIDKLDAPQRRKVEILIALITAVTFIAIAWLSGRLAWDEYRFEVMSPGLGKPQWIYTIWLPILSVIIVLRLLGRAIRVWRYGSQEPGMQGSGGIDPL